MPGAAGDGRWVLWVFDYGEYVGERAEGVEEAAWVGLWGVECGGGGLSVRHHQREFDVEPGVQARSVHGISGSCQTWVIGLRL